MFKNAKWLAPFLVVLLVITSLAVPAYASETVEIQRLEQKGTNYVFLEWDAYADADGYSLYRSKENGPFYFMKDVTSCSTYNYSLEIGKCYSYKIRPYRLLENGNKEYLAEGKSASIQIGVKAPTSLKVSVSGKAAMTISWEGDPLAERHVLYRSTDNMNWILVKSVYGTSTTTYSLEEGETYYFRVKSVRTINGTTQYSGYSESAKCTLGIAAPGYLKLKAAYKNSVELQWEEVPNATGYRLYRAENGGAYKLVKTVTGNTTKNYNLNPDVTYTYQIAAIMEVGKQTFKSGYTYADPVKLSLDSVQQLHIERVFSNGVRIGWESVEGATGYRLYRTGEDGVTKLIKTVSETVTNTYSLTAGQCYRFSVKPICVSGAATVNGISSEEVSVFCTESPNLTVVQQEVNSVHLRWNGVTGAEEYLLKIQQTGKEDIQKRVSGTEAELEITAPGELTVTLYAVRAGAASAGISIQYTPIYEKTLSFAIAKVTGEGKVSLAWEPVEHGVQYEVQRFNDIENAFVTVAVCTNTSIVDADVLADTTYQYRYRVSYGEGANAIWGNWSEIASVTTQGAPKYRALLIGEENYDVILEGPRNDIEAMRNTLSGLSAMNWSIYSQLDATREEILGLIPLAFEGASENDISLFYFSGHGVVQSGEYYAGALSTVDYDFIPMQELAASLATIPGKVIVLLDSCGSGAAISSGAAETVTYVEKAATAFDPAAFNEQVIQIFSAYNAQEQSKAGELATDKFYVLTSSAYEQTSNSVGIDDIWGGLFTRAFVGSAGYHYDTKSWNDKMNADVNGDNCVTLSECYEYCRKQAEEYQDVQVYPRDSTVRLLFK